MKWNASHSTGSAALDQQHQVLIEYVNRLGTLTQGQFGQKSAYEEMLKILDFLDFYSREHFRAEEACMHAFQCPAHQKNKDSHAQFLLTYGQFKNQLKYEGLTLPIMRSIHQYLSLWVSTHFQEIDAQLMPCIKGRPRPTDQPKDRPRL
ncbi:MAG TPA: hemerythrin domain-containing protein [Verrucomicrobiae bacterium]